MAMSRGAFGPFVEPAVQPDRPHPCAVGPQHVGAHGVADVGAARRVDTEGIGHLPERAGVGLRGIGRRSSPPPRTSRAGAAVRPRRAAGWLFESTARRNSSSSTSSVGTVSAKNPTHSSSSNRSSSRSRSAGSRLGSAAGQCSWRWWCSAQVLRCHTSSGTGAELPAHGPAMLLEGGDHLVVGELAEAALDRPPPVDEGVVEIEDHRFDAGQRRDSGHSCTTTRPRIGRASIAHSMSIAALVTRTQPWEAG